MCAHVEGLVKELNGDKASSWVFNALLQVKWGFQFESLPDGIHSFQMETFSWIDSIITLWVSKWNQIASKSVDAQDQILSSDFDAMNSSLMKIQIQAIWLLPPLFYLRFQQIRIQLKF